MKQNQDSGDKRIWQITKKPPTQDRIYGKQATKPPKCFAFEPRACGVRVDLSPQKSIVLLHEHFVYAEFMADEQIDLLKLVFVTHEVSLTGCLRRRIETAVCRGYAPGLKNSAFKIPTVCDEVNNAGIGETVYC